MMISFLSIVSEENCAERFIKLSKEALEKRPQEFTEAGKEILTYLINKEVSNSDKKERVLREIRKAYSISSISNGPYNPITGDDGRSLSDLPEALFILTDDVEAIFEHYKITGVFLDLNIVKSMCPEKYKTEKLYKVAEDIFLMDAAKKSTFWDNSQILQELIKQEMVAFELLSDIGGAQKAKESVFKILMTTLVLSKKTSVKIKIEKAKAVYEEFYSKDENFSQKYILLKNDSYIQSISSVE